MDKYFLKKTIKKILIEEIENINFEVENYSEKPDCTFGKLKANNWSDLYNKLIKLKYISQKTPMLIVWGPTQKMYYTEDGINLIKDFPISTGKKGFGNEEGMGKTAVGLMKIARKIQAPEKYQVLVGKKPYNSVLKPNTLSKRIVDGKPHYAEVTTGLIELVGLENCNKNTFNRAIYIHGTNLENSLGKPASGGCVRTKNNDILWLINNIKNNTYVYVYSS